MPADTKLSPAAGERAHVVQEGLQNLALWPALLRRAPQRPRFLYGAGAGVTPVSGAIVPAGAPDAGLPKAPADGGAGGGDIGGIGFGPPPAGMSMESMLDLMIAMKADLTRSRSSSRSEKKMKKKKKRKNKTSSARGRSSSRGSNDNGKKKRSRSSNSSSTTSSSCQRSRSPAKWTYKGKNKSTPINRRSFLENERWKRRRDLLQFAMRRPGAMTAHFVCSICKKLSKPTPSETKHLISTSAVAWAKRHSGLVEIADQREALSLCTLLDHLDQREVERCADVLVQRIQEIVRAKTKGGNWGTAETFFLLPSSAAGLASANLIALSGEMPFGGVALNSFRPFVALGHFMRSFTCSLALFWRLVEFWVVACVVRCSAKAGVLMPALPIMLCFLYRCSACACHQEVVDVSVARIEGPSFC